MHYRKIYEKHYGLIPKDSDGRTYQIHHKDGNRSNNSIDNLQCVSIQEHYNIHYSQGDWGACYYIALTMKSTSEELAELSRKTQLQYIKDKTHIFLTPNFQRKNNLLRINEGTHHFIGNSNPTYQRIQNGTHNFIGNTHPVYKKIENGSHHFQGKNGSKLAKERNYKWILENKHPSQFQWICEYCNKKRKRKGMLHKMARPKL